MNTPNTEAPVILGLNEVGQVTGLCPQTVLSLYANGLFPAPVFHRPPTWTTETVANWLRRAACTDARDDTMRTARTGRRKTGR